MNGPEAPFSPRTEGTNQMAGWAGYFLCSEPRRHMSGLQEPWWAVRLLKWIALTEIEPRTRGDSKRRRVLGSRRTFHSSRGAGLVLRSGTRNRRTCRTGTQTVATGDRLRAGRALRSDCKGDDAAECVIHRYRPVVYRPDLDLVGARYGRRPRCRRSGGAIGPKRDPSGARHVDPELILDRRSAAGRGRAPGDRYPDRTWHCRARRNARDDERRSPRDCRRSRQ